MIVIQESNDWILKREDTSTTNEITAICVSVLFSKSHTFREASIFLIVCKNFYQQHMSDIIHTDINMSFESIQAFFFDYYISIFDMIDNIRKMSNSFYALIFS